MSNGALAKRYARAILELAAEQRLVDKVGKELTELAAVFADSLELQGIFANPKTGAEGQKAVLKEIATRMGVSPVTRSSVLYLADQGRISALSDIARTYATLAEERGGTVRAEVTSAAPLPESYYVQLARALEQTTGKKVTIERKTDPSLIAGVVTRIGDQVFDGSVRTRLNDLKESLRSA
jgi:F-type H+-transporting ATPase subunit delta